MAKAAQERKLNPHQKEIVKTLLEHDYWMSTTEICKAAGISWNTAKSYLDAMNKLGWVAKKKEGNREYWMASREGFIAED
ncbi:MAG: winged helix-turn-helix transcriptional regulator [Candidatus Micrarchaeota archaeon]|nr:winged helix-turn-helix transcriptional regulator [Candidatus Micrarchaeota archaeon]